MGFDNECIVNIQSLAGEYFCPVCRLLVYPNEALQSQCTHLYCKPCLTYVVGTTRACPYDGYLVTEADSKPLVESNKALAETIGKITVRCLYHRSGCQWQGSLSDCTSHCSGCAFGNSPVVCNRCAVQIVHRQVQEHAQNCPGVQPQAAQPQGTQNLAATAAVGSTNVEQSQTAAQSGVVAQTAQTGPALATGHDPNLQANANAQVHGVASSVVPTPEQLYQQQYQQYYQQYPGYDPYQQAYQNYYPYPQQPQVYSQPQAQAQVQPQPQPQPQPHQQLPVQSQPQAPGQAQTQPLNHIPAAVNPNYQTHLAPSQPTQMMPQAHPPSHGYPQPQPHSTHPQPQQMQMPQFPQPQPQMQQNPAQMQPQPHSHSHPQQQTVFQQPQQTQYPQAQPQHQPPNQSLSATAQGQTQQSLSHGVTSHHSYSQPHAHQQMQLRAQQLPSSHPQNGPMPHLPPQIHGQFPQQHHQMGVPQAHPPLPNQQPPMQLPPQGQVSSIPPGQQRPVVPYAQQSGHPVHQHPAMPQQQMQHQQPFSGQASGPVSNQLLPRGQHVQLPPPPPLHPQGPSGLQHQQPHNYSARPVMPNQEAQSQPFAQSPAAYTGQAQGRSAQLGANQHLFGQNHQLKTNNQVQISPGQQSAQSEMNLKPLEKNLADQKNESPAQKTAEKEPNSLAPESGLRTESVEAKNLKSDVDAKIGGKEDANREFDRHDKNTGRELYGLQSALIQPASSGVKSLEAVAIEQKNGSDLSQQGKKMTMDDTSKERSGNLTNDATNVGGVMSQTAPVGSAHISDGTAKSEATFMGPERSIGQSHSQVLGKGSSQLGFPFPPADQGRGPQLPLHYPSPHQPPIPQSALPQGPLHNAQMPGQSPSMLRPQGPGHLPQPGQPHGSVPDIASGGMPGSFPPPPGRVSLYGDVQGNFGQGRAPLYSAEGHIGQQHPLNPVVNEVFFDHQSRFMDGQSPAAKSQVRNLKEAAGTDSSLTAGLRDERLKPLTDRVPRPLDKELLGLNSDSGQKLERGAMGAHGFLPPYHPGGTNEAGDRAPVGPDGNVGRGDFAHTRPDFLGPVAAVGGHHMDRFAPRSPGRENAGFPPRGYGNHPSFPRNQPGLNDFGGRLFDGGPRPLRFPSDLAGNSFPESRFPPFTGQFRRGELEGPGFMRGNEFIGEDFPSHLSRGEFQGTQNLPAHLRYGDPAGFGSFPDHARRVGPENFPPHPPFGDQFGGNMPGHPNNRASRSSYPPAGGLDPFDPSRKRKPLSNGWCRICKVDCEGVEGLELHSQTKEHQDMAMDMVRSIKLQNTKKQKIPIDRSSFEEPSKSRVSVFEVRGNGP